MNYTKFLTLSFSALFFISSPLVSFASNTTLPNITLYGTRADDPGEPTRNDLKPIIKNKIMKQFNNLSNNGSKKINITTDNILFQNQEITAGSFSIHLQHLASHWSVCPGERDESENCFFTYELQEDTSLVIKLKHKGVESTIQEFGPQ